LVVIVVIITVRASFSRCAPRLVHS
jgi:hypothetical protein